MTGYEVLDLIMSLFYNVFGNPLLVTAVIFSMLLITLVMFRAPLILILMILIPLTAGFILNIAYSNFIEIPAYLLVVLFIIAGLIFSMFFMQLIK